MSSPAARIAYLLAAILFATAIGSCTNAQAPSTSSGAAVPETFAYPPPGGLAYPPPSGETNPFRVADAPNPEPGKASISGAIYSFTIHQLVPETAFYLTPVHADEVGAPPFFDGPEPSRGDISAKTDARGQFSLNNITPGKYYLAVSAPYNWSAALISDTEFTPRLIELGPDQKQPLGVVFVSWP